MKANDPAFSMGERKHAKSQMQERDLIMGDVLHVLKNGFVYEDPKPATQKGRYRYRMISKTPNSSNREVAVIVIPDPPPAVVLVSVMWVDETSGQWS